MNSDDKDPACCHHDNDDARPASGPVAINDS